MSGPDRPDTGCRVRGLGPSVPWARFVPGIPDTAVAPQRRPETQGGDVGTYVIRRLLQMIPVILGATFLIFAMVFALPGDPLAGKCGERPCPPAYAAAFREKYNLNDPLPVQYGKYLGNLVQGDLGETYNGVKVTEQLSCATR